MKKILRLELSARPALDMTPIDSKEILYASTMRYPDLLKGLGFSKRDADALETAIWIPVDLDDSDYEYFRSLGIETPDYIPVFECDCLSEATSFFTHSSEFDEIELVYQFDLFEVSWNNLYTWWDDMRKKKGIAG